MPVLQREPLVRHAVVLEGVEQRHAHLQRVEAEDVTDGAIKVDGAGSRVGIEGKVVVE